MIDAFQEKEKMLDVTEAFYFIQRSLGWLLECCASYEQQRYVLSKPKNKMFEKQFQRLGGCLEAPQRNTFPVQCEHQMAP